MITVLIAKDNKKIIEAYSNKFKFLEASKNTCTCKVDDLTFDYLKKWLRLKGINPYSLMYWY